MKRLIAILVLMAGSVFAADLPTNWSFNVKLNIDASNDVAVTEWAKTLPALYTNVTLITNGVTNVVAIVVQEGPKQKLKRNAGELLQRWISDSVRATEISAEESATHDRIRAIRNKAPAAGVE
jgi:hypothetical protein